MPRRRISQLSQQIRAAVHEEKRAPRREATVYKRQISERANQIPAANRTALIQAAGKILKETQDRRQNLKTPPNQPANQTALSKHTKEIASAIFIERKSSIPPDLEEEPDYDVLQLAIEENIEV